MDDKKNVDIDSLFNQNPFKENQDIIDNTSINKIDNSVNSDEIEVLSLDDDFKDDSEFLDASVSNITSDNSLAEEHISDASLVDDSVKDDSKPSSDIISDDSLAAEPMVEHKSDLQVKKRKIGFSSLEDMKPSHKRIAIFLVIVVGILSLWYAFFAQPLAFNVRQLIISKKVEETETNGSWDIKFTKIVQGDVVGLAKELSTPSISSTRASFYLSLSKPGDSFTYKITIRNEGTINAKVSDIIISPENSDRDVVFYHVDGVKVDDFLDAGKETEVTVTAQYNSEHVGPAIPVAKNVMVLINYVQRS